MSVKPDRTCTKCGVSQAHEFFLRRKEPELLRSYCDKCARIGAAKWWRKNGQAYMQKQRDSNGTKRNYSRRYIDPIKNRAQSALRNAVASGKVIKATNCEDCGTTGRLHGHHEDYAKKLSVNWLCPACHSLRHAKYKFSPEILASYVRVCRGEQIAGSKLTETKVLEILELYAKGTKPTLLARRFGVTHQSISLILNGKTWKHISAPALAKLDAGGGEG